MSTPSIFISYRRDDGIDTAQLLQVNLQKIFGEDSVFLDTNSLNAGDNFPDYLKNAVRNSKVVVVLIGKNWKGTQPNQNRLAYKNDWVRKELEVALEKSDAAKKIFPVLIKGATIESSFKDLPSSLEILTTINCATLREKEFSQDLLPLISLIGSYVDLDNPLKDLPLDEEKYSYPLYSPFKGLDYFNEEDAKIFFGRGQEIRQLYNIISERNIVLFYGQSGVGKSSLLFAGLKPRMNFKRWNVAYIRRETGVNLAIKLGEYITNSSLKGKQLVILDQVEEIYTNPDPLISTKEEAEKLFKEIQRAAEAKFKIIVSFRKEYFAEFKHLFKPLNAEDLYLKPLQLTGVLNAICGITEDQKACDVYQLTFSDKTVPAAIAQTVISDDQSHAAPLLQMLLRKMWDKVSGKKPRIFSKELFEDTKTNSLITLINDQISAVSERFPDEGASGLVLDILYYFTTARGTSASRTGEELLNHYDSAIAAQVLTDLKNKYLISEPKKENVNISRLSHDSLAPIIREMYFQSTLPGQRASILLDSKKYEIESKPEEVEFSKPDLAIIEFGKSGMRKWMESEKHVIETSRKKAVQHKLELEEKNKQLEKALIEVKEQILQTRAKAMAATARGVAETDPTLGIRLAEASMQVTPTPTIESRIAFVDILKSNINFSKKIFSFNDEVHSCCFSPDGQHILVTNGARAFLLNFHGEVIQIFTGHDMRVTSIAFSKDGKSIITGSWDNTARIWDLNGKSIQIFKGHTSWLSSVAFSPDGKSIITGSGDNTIRLWNLNGETIQVIDGFYAYSVVFSPDGKFILVGCANKSAILWDLKGKIIQVFEGHTKDVFSAAFSSNGEFVLTGSGDKTAKLWDLNGKLIQVFEGHNSGLASVSFSPDNKSILTGSEDKTAILWELNGKQSFIFKGHLQRLYSVSFSPDGKLILTGSFDKTIRLWDLRNNISKIVHRVEESTSFFDSFPLSPDGKNILAFGDKENIPKLFNLKFKMIQAFKGHSSDVTAASFSPDGKYILTASQDSTVRLWDLNGNTIHIYNHEHPNYLGFGAVAFSNDGKFILATDADGRLYFWDLKGILIRIIKTGSVLARAIAFSPDDRHILIGKSPDNTALLLDITGKIVKVFKGHSNPVGSVAFSKDNKYILTGSMDNTARLWDIKSTSILQIFEHSSTVNAVAFSPDSNTIITSSDDDLTQRWSLYWNCLDKNNTAIPSLEQMREYEIPGTIEWGKKWE